MTSVAKPETESLTEDQLVAEIARYGDLIKGMKAMKLSKEEIQPTVDGLLALKTAYAARIQSKKDRNRFDRPALESLLLKRFFYSPSFAVYGGVAGLYDFGPPGTALLNNIISIWRRHFVLEEDMLEIECTNLTPEAVLKTSGHVDRFADYMVYDVKTNEIFRADHLVKQVLKQRLEDDEEIRAGTFDKKKLPKGKTVPDLLEPAARQDYEAVLESLDNYQGDDLWKLMQRLQIKAPETGNDVSEPVLFNLMFDTQIGPSGKFKGFLRPETAQGHFLNFKRLLEFNIDSMPFASASIGKSFRNEISPRQGLLRVREFTMAEIEHYVDPLKKDHPRFTEVADVVIPLYPAKSQLAGTGPVEMTIGEAVKKGIVNNETLGYFVARIYLFLIRLGIKKERLRFRQHMANEMAHYACDCWDAEIHSSYGWVECVGCADRSAYDLTAHSKATGQKLVVREALPEPLIREHLVLELNKKKIGPILRGDAEALYTHLDTFITEGGEKEKDDWDEAKLEALDKALKEGGGKTTLADKNGKVFNVTSEMFKIFRRTDTIHVREFTPNVIEPSFGLGRIMYSLLEHIFWVRDLGLDGDENRHVLSFPASVAPIKALILPISNNSDFNSYIKNVAHSLRARGVSSRVDDSSTSIGRRYARNDELGTPFAVTVDFQTVKDGTVTLRERDSLKQIRETIPVIVNVITELVEERTSWAEVSAKYPEFVAQEI